MTDQRTRAEISAAGMVEAVLFAAGNPMTANEIAHIIQLDLIGTQNILQELTQELAERHSGLTIRHVAGGYQLATRPEAFATVERLSQVVDRKISAPTMEMLSIVAFRQPITKAEVEHIRGVRVERALQKLMELELIAEVGRKKVLGRPILYGTTDTFLRCFGINTLDDLPALPTTEEIAAGLDTEQLELFQEVRQMKAVRDTERDDETKHSGDSLE